VLVKVQHHKCRLQIYAVDIPRVGPGNRTIVGKLVVKEDAMDHVWKLLTV
jgi:hypothetical protein